MRLSGCGLRTAFLGAGSARVKSSLRLLVFAFCFSMLASSRGVATEAAPQPTAILSAVELAADWQLAHPARHDPKDWMYAPFYAGLVALGEISPHSRFHQAALAIGDKNGWKLFSDPYNADHQAVAQAYLELYLKHRRPEMIADAQRTFDFVLGHPTTLWYWCDALFMGPPAWTRMTVATGNPAYLEYALAFWRTTTEQLYDRTEKLYYRDESYIAQRGPDGKKIFWSRGNGWVIAGLARVLQFLPREHPSRAPLETQFREMANRIVELQQADGLWRASLLEPERYPEKEASGSAFFCYALAWGVNQGLLDRKRYAPPLFKAWPALTGCLEPEGKLIRIQPIGAGPDRIPPDATEPYGVGAFILAGTELYRLAGGTLPAPSSENSVASRVWNSGADDRMRWSALAGRVVEPVLSALAQRRLKTSMPVEEQASAQRAACTHLEAMGRTLAGIAPWLELGDDGSAEGADRARLARLARQAIDAATDPTSPDHMNFDVGTQPLVDAAFLAQAILRAPKELGEKLEPNVRENLVASLKASRTIQPYRSNWLLFASMVEVVLQRLGEPRDEARLREGLDRFQEWYLGDGVYGDGSEFHWDYYNAFVIQPMLVEILEAVGDETPEWRAFRTKVAERARRYAAIQERLIAPDGSYPVIGRSIAYRCGAFQGLAQSALRHALPESVTPGQARAALNAVIRRTLEAPGTFDDRGWLRIGLAGHQPSLGEYYISTGSLYLCCVAFLPLGLPATDPFWSDAPGTTTWERVWSGGDLPADHALKESP